MNHQLQQLLNFRLKLQIVFCHGHRLPVRLFFVFEIRAVIPGAVENDSRSGTDLALERLLSAGRTFFQLRIGHFLKHFQFLAAFFADIFIRWH